MLSETIEKSARKLEENILSGQMPKHNLAVAFLTLVRLKEPVADVWAHLSLDVLGGKSGNSIFSDEELEELIMRMANMVDCKVDAALGRIARYGQRSVRPIALWCLAQRGAEDELKSLANDQSYCDDLQVKLRPVLLAIRDRCELNDPAFDELFQKARRSQISAKGHLVHKLKAKDSTGRWAYYFVLVLEYNEKAFLDSLKSKETIDLETFGQVIASCYGEQPNDNVKRLLLENYGFVV